MMNAEEDFDLSEEIAAMDLTAATADLSVSADLGIVSSLSLSPPSSRHPSQPPSLTGELPLSDDSKVLLTNPRITPEKEISSGTCTPVEFAPSIADPSKTSNLFVNDSSDLFSHASNTKKPFETTSSLFSKSNNDDDFLQVTSTDISQISSFSLVGNTAANSRQTSDANVHNNINNIPINNMYATKPQHNINASFEITSHTPIQAYTPANTSPASNNMTQSYVNNGESNPTINQTAFTSVNGASTTLTSIRNVEQTYPYIPDSPSTQNGQVQGPPVTNSSKIPSYNYQHASDHIIKNSLSFKSKNPSTDYPSPLQIQPMIATNFNNSPFYPTSPTNEDQSSNYINNRTYDSNTPMMNPINPQNQAPGLYNPPNQNCEQPAAYTPLNVNSIPPPLQKPTAYQAPNINNPLPPTSQNNTGLFIPSMYNNPLDTKKESPSYFVPSEPNQNATSLPQTNQWQPASQSQQSQPMQNGYNVLQPSQQLSPASYYDKTYETLNDGSYQIQTGVDEHGKGIWQWIKDTVNKDWTGGAQNIRKQIKHATDSVLTTLDPGMQDYLKPSVNIGIASQSTPIILGVKEGFNNSFGTAIVKGQHYHNSTTPLLPVGFETVLKATAESLDYLTTVNFNFLTEYVLVTSQVFITELVANQWSAMICLALRDVSRNLNLHSFSQAIPLPIEIVNIAYNQTSAQTENWNGCDVTIDDAVRYYIPYNNEQDWCMALTGIPLKQIVSTASQCLAEDYKRQKNTINMSMNQPEFSTNVNYPVINYQQSQQQISSNHYEQSAQHSTAVYNGFT